MVARDHVGIDAAHSFGALETWNCRAMVCAVVLRGAAGSPACQPCIGRARIGEQRTQGRLVAGGCVRESPPPDGEIQLLGMKQIQPVFNQPGIGTVVVRFASMKPELDTLSAKQVPAELRRERNDDRGGHRDRLLWIVRQEGQQRFGQTCKIPARNVGLVAEGVASLVVDGAEDRAGIVGLHKRARPVIDSLARYRHVVCVHHAMDETHVHPLRDQRSLTLSHILQQSQEGLRGGHECGIVADDRVLR